MPTNRLSSEERFIKNILIGFFAALFITLVITLIALFKTLINYPNSPELPTVTIQDCYNGNTCKTTKGEQVRLACVGTSLQGIKADPIADKAAKEYLNKLFSGSIVTSKRLTKDSYGKTVAEVSKKTYKYSRTAS